MNPFKWIADTAEMVLNGHKKAGVKVEQEARTFAVPIKAWNTLADQKLALEAKLEAAAEALRQIECNTNSNEYVYANDVWEDINKKAQDALQEINNN